MLIFIISLILVLIGADLFVRFVVDPLILGSKQKNKISKSSAPKLNPSFKLATETMYDGGKPIKKEASGNEGNDENISKDEVES